jgi:hypothetical protein
MTNSVTIMSGQQNLHKWLKKTAHPAITVQKELSIQLNAEQEHILLAADIRKNQSAQQ